uniref:pleckstrin-like n=1 Tax=Myxine glutinosa TaxID=7769 RepID=UPI00358ED8DD
MEETIREGYLVKRGHLVHNWKARWFVLQTKTLAYYKEGPESVRKGSVGLAACEVVCPCHEYNKRPLVLKVVNGSYTLVIQAASLDERDAWVHDIRTAAECLRANCTFKRTSVRKSVGSEHMINLQKMLLQLKDPNIGIKQENFPIKSKVYKDCFSGASVVNWLMSVGGIISRASAVQTGSMLLGEAYLRPMGSMAKECARTEQDETKRFLDELDALYCFTDSRHYIGADSSDDDNDILREGFRGRIVKQGCLMKQGHKRNNWKIRKFVLRDDPAYLHYFDPSKENMRNPLGGFCIKGCIISAMDASNLPPGEKSEELLIHIITRDDVHYYVKAASADERQQWLQALKKLC